MTADTWIEQEDSPQFEISATGQGSYVRRFLATKDRGAVVAFSRGITPGTSLQVDQEIYSFDRLRVRNYQGAFDLVEAIYVSQQGGGGGGGSADGRVHKVGDEEWEMDCRLDRMTLQEAIDRGLIGSIADLPEGSPLTASSTIDVPVPILIRRLWDKGVKKTRPLPMTSEEALEQFAAPIEYVGKKVGPYLCDDVQVRADGFLRLLTLRYSYNRYAAEMNYANV